MTLENLDNLVKVGQLKKEPPDQAEIERLIKSAERRLQDAEIEGLSEEGRFSWPMVPRTRWLQRRCDGTDTVPIIATWFSNVCNTRLKWNRRRFVYWRFVTINAILQSMKVSSRYHLV